MYPCDECSFRVRFYATSKVHALLSLQLSDAQCLADLTLCKTLQLQSPGACSLEYQSMMQIIIKALIGWDQEKQLRKMAFLEYQKHLVALMKSKVVKHSMAICLSGLKLQ